MTMRDLLQQPVNPGDPADPPRCSRTTSGGETEPVKLQGVEFRGGLFYKGSSLYCALLLKCS